MIIDKRGDYLALFPNQANVSGSQKEALSIAREERARELDLYWKRANYFWTLIAATFAGYFALLDSDHPGQSLLIVTCLGFVCATVWYFVNRGSKYWQEIWELQVELLETEICGPLHRVSIDHSSYRLRDLHRAYPFSVTRLNQLLSLFIVVIWAALLVDAVYRTHWTLRDGSLVPAIVIGISVATVCSLLVVGRTGTFKAGTRVKVVERQSSLSETMATAENVVVMRNAASTPSGAF
jgi:hypothetical protein